MKPGTDLSSFHTPLLDRSDESAPSVPVVPFLPNAAFVEKFERDGFTDPVPLLSLAAVERLREEVARLKEPDHPGRSLFHEVHGNESKDPTRVLFHALGGWRIEPGLHDLVLHPTLASVASTLLGGAVRLWHDQLFVKPARHGGVVAWHQDYSYWTRTQFTPERPVAHLTAFVALDDTDAGNGGIQYVPGSHRFPLLPVTGLTGDMDAILDVLDDEQRSRFHPVAVRLRAGEAVFHHALTIHGSFANTADRPRRAAVVNVFRDGTRSLVPEPLLDGVPPFPAGSPIEGQFFPRLGN